MLAFTNVMRVGLSAQTHRCLHSHVTVPGLQRKDTRPCSLRAAASSNGGGHDLLVKGLQVESVLKKRDASVLDSLLASDVVLHKDSITLQDDLEGKEAVQGYYANYVNNFKEDHTTLNLALNEAHRSVFFLVVETGIKPEKGDDPASSSAGIFKHVFNEQGQISDIFFIRQPSAGELDRQFKDPSQMKEGPGIGPGDLRSKFAGEAVVEGKLVELAPADPARVKQVYAAAEQYSNLYGSNAWPKDGAEFEKIFEPTVTSYDMLFGAQTTGIQEVSGAIESISKNFDSSDHEHDIAVTPDGNSAFIHWSNRGLLKRGMNEASKDNLKGFTFLSFRDGGNIQTVLGFRQPTSQEREKLFGEEAPLAINY